jgi:mono/diheme cytochrome c family protein
MKRVRRDMAMALCAAALLAAGCDRSLAREVGMPESAAAPKSADVMRGSSGKVPRHNDPVKIARGRQIYQAHCAGCHGDRAQGAPNWRQRDADGFYPPPPLDDSGHAWHHSIAGLKEIIDNGSPPGQGRMPGWKDRLSIEDVDAVVAWFQSLWSDEVYGEWYAMQRRAFGR